MSIDDVTPQDIDRALDQILKDSPADQTADQTAADQIEVIPDEADPEYSQEEKDQMRLELIEDYWLDNGYGPTMTECIVLLGFGDRPPVTHFVARMEEQGRLRTVDVGGRAKMVWPKGISVAVRSECHSRTSVYDGAIWVRSIANINQTAWHKNPGPDKRGRENLRANRTSC